MKKFDVILADPPWYYQNQATRAATKNHYPTMSFGDIYRLPVEELAADRCALFLWATWPNLKEALRAIEYWGFQYKTIAWVWMKTNKAGDKYVIGLGNYTRSNTEPCLLAFKGKPLKVVDKSIPAYIVSPRMEHSAKPDLQYEYIYSLYPFMNMVELFARKRRELWDSWGNEIESTIKFDHHTRNWSEA